MMNQDVFSAELPPALDSLPNGWTAVRLKHVAHVRYGLGQPPREMEGGLPLIRATNIKRGRITREGLLFVDPADIPTGRDAVLREGEIVVVRSGAYTGDSAIVPSEFVGSITGYDMVVRPLAIEPRFLAYLLLSAPILNDQIDLCRLRAAQPHLNAHELGNIILPHPSIVQQHTIADFLDEKTAAIDALIAKKERLIELIEEKRQATITRAVTKGLDPDVPMKDSGIEWLGEVPAHWEVAPLGYMVRVLGGGTPSKQREDFWGGPIPWVSPKDMKRDIIDDAEDSITVQALQSTNIPIVQPPAVLMVVRGMILAHTVPIALTATPLTVNQDMKALLPIPGLLAGFLALYLQAVNPTLLVYVEEAGHGTKRLPSELWQKLTLAVPPIDEQQRIAEQVDQANRRSQHIVQKITEQVTRLHEYRQTLISAAVTGQLDLTTRTTRARKSATEPTPASPQEVPV